MKNRNFIASLMVLISCFFILTIGGAGAGFAMDFLVPETQEAGPPIVLVFDPVPKPNWVAPPQEFLEYALQTATIYVNFLPAGSLQHEYTCQTWPVNAQTAFNYAASIAGSLVNSPVQIQINACWTDLGGSGTLGLGGPAYTVRNFSPAARPNTWYTPALANAIKGIDTDPLKPDILTTYNSSRTDWYFGTDGNPGSKLDFVSVVLHEIWHGLNFSGSMSVTNGLGSWEWGDCGNPSIYDRFTDDGASGPLLNYTCGSTSLAAALQSNNIFFDGANANAVNGGSRVPLYAPNSWKQGSSYSHLAESYNGTANALMTYSIGYNEANHHPGPVGLCLLRDLGWTINGSCGSVGSKKMYLPLVLNNYGTTSGWSTIISEDFEGAFPGSWTLLSRGDYIWGKRACRPYAGSYGGWGVGGGTTGASLSCGSNYPDNANSWMVYGPFSLVGATKGDLNFKLWLNSELNQDGVCRLVSIDGTNFSGNCTSGNTNGWIDRTLDLTNVSSFGNLMGQPNVWVALLFSSNSSTTYAEGGYVDNVVLRKCPTGATCPAGSNQALTTDSQIIEIPAQMTLPR